MSQETIGIDSRKKMGFTLGEVFVFFDSLPVLFPNIFLKLFFVHF